MLPVVCVCLSVHRAVPVLASAAAFKAIDIVVQKGFGGKQVPLCVRTPQVRESMCVCTQKVQTLL